MRKLEYQPVEKTGKKKGEPRPMPHFELDGQQLMLHTPTAQTPYKAHNPLGRRSPAAPYAPYWTHEAWAEVIRRANMLMETLQSEISAEAGEA